MPAQTQTINFKYKKLKQGIKRPIIPVTLINPITGQRIRTELLVDSGADINLIDAELGEAIGIDIQSGIKRSVTGITGDSMYYWLHTVVIELKMHKTKTGVGFTYFKKDGQGVLGQFGFFDTAKITFDYRSGHIVLRPH